MPSHTALRAAARDVVQQCLASPGGSSLPLARSALTQALLDRGEGEGEGEEGAAQDEEGQCLSACAQGVGMWAVRLYSSCGGQKDRFIF